MPVIPVILTAVSSFFSGFFNFKGDQAKTVQQAMSTLGQLNETEAQAVVAQAQAMAAILTQGSFLERNWRAVLMVVLSGILVASFFGYLPSGMSKEMSPMMSELFELLKIGLGGYIARYGVRDLVREFKLSSIILELVKKKIG